MNHIYRVIFNRQTGVYQAVSEIATQNTGTKSSKTSLAQKLLKTTKSILALTISAIIGTSVLSAHASPTGGQVTAGVANINQAGSITNINQSSQNAAINWQSFNVGKNETVNFNQPNAQSVTLNRVIGNERSVIDGAMNANGKVFISNANGMLIGKDAKINVGSLVATTANISDDDLMNGRYQFTGEGAGSIENLGHISVPKGGVVALVAPIVKNGGTITAHEGNALLASAESFSITLPDNANFAYTLDKGTLQGLVDNGGAILADAGRVVLTAKGVDTVKKSLIKHSGKIEANTVQNKNGVIELLGDLDNTRLEASGSLKAEAKEKGDGGFIETSAAKVSIRDLSVSTKSKFGKTGEWLIDPQDFNINADSGEHTETSIGADILSQNLQATDITISTDSNGSEKGDIYVNAPVSWDNNRLTLSAHNNIYINENLNGSGNARLELKYGQASENAIQADGTESDYYIQKGKKIDLPTGQNLVVQRGSSSDNARRLTVLHSLPNDGRLFPKYVALGTDLNLSGQPFTQGLNGVELFHGLGHEIDGLEIDHTQNMSGQSPEHIGFIPNLSGGIRDLTLNNVNIKTQINDDCDGNCNEPIGVGALIGRAGDATIKNVYVSGKMSDLGNYDNVKMGGLIGIADGRVRVINSHADVNIEKQEQTQANELVGLDNGGLSVENSQGTGNITNIEPTPPVTPTQPVNPPAPTTPPTPTQPANPTPPVTQPLQPVPTPQPTTQPVIPTQPAPTTPPVPTQPAPTTPPVPTQPAPTTPPVPTQPAPTTPPAPTQPAPTTPPAPAQPAPTTPPPPTQPVNPSTPVTPQLQPVPTPQPTTQPVIPAQPAPTTPPTPTQPAPTTPQAPQNPSNTDQNQPTAGQNTSQNKPTPTQDKPKPPTNTGNQQPVNTNNQQQNQVEAPTLNSPSEKTDVPEKEKPEATGYLADKIPCKSWKECQDNISNKWNEAKNEYNQRIQTLLLEDKREDLFYYTNPSIKKKDFDAYINEMYQASQNPAYISDKYLAKFPKDLKVSKHSDLTLYEYLSKFIQYNNLIHLQNKYNNELVVFSDKYIINTPRSNLVETYTDKMQSFRKQAENVPQYKRGLLESLEYSVKDSLYMFSDVGQFAVNGAQLLGHARPSVKKIQAAFKTTKASAEMIQSTPKLLAAMYEMLHLVAESSGTGNFDINRIIDLSINSIEAIHKEPSGVFKTGKAANSVRKLIETRNEIIELGEAMNIVRHIPTELLHNELKHEIISNIDAKRHLAILDNLENLVGVIEEIPGMGIGKDAIATITSIPKALENQNTRRIVDIYQSNLRKVNYINENYELAVYYRAKAIESMIK